MSSDLLKRITRAAAVDDILISDSAAFAGVTDRPPNAWLPIGMLQMDRLAAKIVRPVDSALAGQPHCALVQNGEKHHARVYPLAQVVWGGNPRTARINFVGVKAMPDVGLAAVWQGFPPHARGLWLGTDHFLRDLGPDGKTPLRWCSDVAEFTPQGQPVFSLWGENWGERARRRRCDFERRLAVVGIDRPPLIVVDDEWTARNRELCVEQQWGPGAWEKIKADPRLSELGDLNSQDMRNFLVEFPQMRMDSDWRHWAWVTATQVVHCESWDTALCYVPGGVVNNHGVSQWLYPCGRAEVPWLSPGGFGTCAGCWQVAKYYPEQSAAKIFSPVERTNVEQADTPWLRVLAAQQAIAGAMAMLSAPLRVVIQSRGQVVDDLLREGWMHAALRSGEPLLVSQEGSLSVAQQKSFADDLGEVLAELDRVTGGYGYRPVVPLPCRNWQDEEIRTSAALGDCRRVTRVTTSDGRGRWE